MVLKKKIFEYFSMHFYGLNLRPLTRGHLGPWDLHLNKLGRGPLGNATYQISNIWAKWFWRRRFFNIFLCISMVGTYDPLARGHLGPWDLGLNKLGKGPPGNATYQISSTWAKQFWSKDFEVYFIFEPKTPPPQGHFRPQGHHSNKLGKGPLRNATYQISRP